MYKVGGGPQAPLSALPIGAESTHDPNRLVLINPTQDLVHSIVAVSCGDDLQQLLEKNIAGYMHM